MVIIIILRNNFSKITTKSILYEKNYSPDYSCPYHNFCF